MTMCRKRETLGSVCMLFYSPLTRHSIPVSLFDFPLAKLQSQSFIYLIFSAKA